MARTSVSIAIAMASAVTLVLVLIQLVSVWGAPFWDFSQYAGVQKDGQVTFNQHWEPRDTGSQYLLGVGKADITG